MILRLSLPMTFLGLVILTGCTLQMGTGDQTKTTYGQTSYCSKDKTVARKDYDAMMSLRRERNLSDFDKLPRAKQLAQIGSSSKLIELFEGGGVVCVREANGKTNFEIWTDGILAYEKEALKEMTDKVMGVAEPVTARREAPVSLPSPFREENREGLAKSEISKQIDLALQQQRIQIEIKKTYSPAAPEGLNERAIIERTKKYYLDNFHKLRPVIEQSLLLNVTNYSTPKAKIQFAAEMKEIAPVLSYFKNKYSQDLSDVVVISAPISEIPHAGPYGNALGVFIPPVAVPIEISFRLPFKEIDPDPRAGNVSGTISVKIDNQAEIILSALKPFFGSQKLILVDSEKVKKNATEVKAFESVVAHELRHLIDYFGCPGSQEKFCDQAYVERDWSDVQFEAIAKKSANLEAYLKDPRTKSSRADAVRISRKDRPESSGDELNARADQYINNFFDQNYASGYPLRFSVKERRGYKEQLQYLVAQNDSPEAAVNTAIAASLPDYMSVPLRNGTTETLRTPGMPWIEALFRELQK